MGKTFTQGSHPANHQIIHSGRNITDVPNVAKLQVSAHLSLDIGIFILERNHSDNYVCGKDFTQKSQDGKVLELSLTNATSVAKPLP